LHAHETGFMQFHAVQRIFANRAGFFRTLSDLHCSRGSRIF
jgi:hypothetical protein